METGGLIGAGFIGDGYRPARDRLSSRTSKKKEEISMRARIVLGLVVSIAVSAALAAQTTPVAMPSADMKWMDLDPKGAPGVKIADLWGDHTKGAFGAI